MSTTNAISPADRLALRDDDIYDSDRTIAQSGRLADLLRDWNTIVREEVGHQQSFDGYDETSRQHQRWHRVMVYVAASSGTVAVLMAIVQLAIPTLPELSGWDWVFIGSDIFASVLAILSVGVGLSLAFHTGWRLWRFKAEQYRFLKFHCLLHAQDWLKLPQPERLEKLRDLLAAMHALHRHDYIHWAQGIKSVVPLDPPIMREPDAALTDDLVRYFRVKRLTDQQTYFERRSHALHKTERCLFWIGPTFFFASILCAFFHFSLEIYERVHCSLHPPPPSPTARETPVADAPHDPPDTPRDPCLRRGPDPSLNLLGKGLIWLLIAAASLPVLGAGFRTFRAAFEFGRNSHRFQGLAILLKEIDGQLTESQLPLAKLLLLYRAEAALVAENRAWSRLMLDAEWFG